MQEENTPRGHARKAPHFDDRLYPAPPALEAYLGRLTAALGEPPQRRNLRRWVWVQEGRDHYHHDAVVVTLNLITHEIHCKSDDETHQPTKEEIEAFKAEKYPDWPHSIVATDAGVQNLRAKLRADYGEKNPTLYVFYNQRNEVTFVQWRILDVDGLKKMDLPWTYWSDGQWRMLEPDGGLPLCGVERLATGGMIILHEGAKKALHWQKMIDSGEWKQHPWGDLLRLCCHIGWPGGALNAERVDWSSIRRLPPHVQVVIICDNDVSGENAASDISRLLMRPLRAVRFGQMFPPNFDLADPFPPEMWKINARGRSIYKGPSFLDCLYPATWATELKGKGKSKSIALRPAFAAEWYHTVKPEVFVQRDMPKYWTTTQFNSLIAPFAHTQDVAALLRKRLHGKADKLAYDPSNKAGMTNTDDGSIINIFRPATIKPKKGDATPWINFMTHLFPDEGDRHQVLRWCATLVVHPEVRMRYGILLVSANQGVGKSTLFYILQQLVGLWNVSFPTENDITKSSFNAWKAKKRLAIIHEIYSGHSKAAYNRLKDTITENHVDVNEKYIPPYVLDNWLHIAASSNTLNALALDDDDRRWLAPRVTEDRRDEDYWRELYAWLHDDDGLAIIRAWMEDFLKTAKPVTTGAHAPMTGTKREIINESRSPGAKLAYDLAAAVVAMRKDHNDDDGNEQKGRKIVLSMTDVRRWVANQRQMGLDDQRLEKLLTLRKAMKAAGMKEPPVSEKDGGVRRFPIDGVPTFVVANFEFGLDDKWAELKPFLCEAGWLAKPPKAD